MGGLKVLHGEVPRWALEQSGYDGYGYGDGSGDGYGKGDYGYGYGDGYSDGYGSGYSFGYAFGDGDGYSDGYGYGYGSGYGSGYGYGGYEDIHHCQPSAVKVTTSHLVKVGACADQVGLFARVFPDGAIWPDDLERAKEAGLEVGWGIKRLGLLPPIPRKETPTA